MQSPSITSLISLDRVCPLTSHPFRDLARRNIPAIPYVLAVASGYNATFTIYDAASLQNFIDQEGFHFPSAPMRSLMPQKVERISIIHYFVLHSFAEPALPLKSSTGPDSTIRDYLQACSPERSRETLECQKRTISWLYKERRWKECHFWTQVVIGQTPNDLATLKLCAELVLDKEKGLETHPGNKIALLEKILHLDPKCDGFATILGQIYLRGARQIQPDLDKARKFFELAIKANSSNQEALSQRTKLMFIGSSKRKGKDHGVLVPPTILMTVKVLSDLLKLPQSHLPSLAELSDILRLDNCLLPEHPQKALKALQRILEVAPENSFAHARIAELYRTGSIQGFEKDKIAATEHFQKALKTAPDDGFALSRFGALRCEYGDNDLRSVVDSLQKARELLPTCTFTLKWLVIFHIQRSKNLLVAKVLLEELLEIDNDNLFALIELALLLTNGCDDFAHDPEMANQFFRTAYQIDPKNVKLLNGWGELLRTVGDGKRKDVQLAKKLFCDALAVDSKNHFAKSRTAEILRKTPGCLKVAEELFLEALQQCPLDAFSEARLGAIYLYGSQEVRQNLVFSEKLLRNAIAHNPYDPFALAHFGELQRRLGVDFVQAEHFLHLAYEKDQNDPDTLSFLGMLYLRGGPGVCQNRLQATVLFEKALRLAPDDYMIVERSRQPSCASFEETKTPTRRKDLLERALLESPKNHFLMISLGETLTQNPSSVKSDFMRAEAVLLKARELSPENLDAIMALAELYRLKHEYFPNRLSIAIELFELANQKEPNKAETLAKIAFCRKKRGMAVQQDLELAEKHLLEARRLEPNNLLVFAILADIYRIKAKGSHIEPRTKLQLQSTAKELLAKALEIDQSCTEVLLISGEFELDLEHVKEAKMCFQKVLQSDPENSDAQAGLARCLETISLT